MIAYHPRYLIYMQKREKHHPFQHENKLVTNVRDVSRKDRPLFELLWGIHIIIQL